MGVKWSMVDEIRLFRWAAQFKPAGLHKHFHMLCIVERMNSPDEYPVTLLQNEEPRKVFTAQDVWTKLIEYYDFRKADLIESVELEDHEFELPWKDYGELMLRNAREVVVEGEDIGGKNGVNIAQRSVRRIRGDSGGFEDGEEETRSKKPRTRAQVIGDVEMASSQRAKRLNVVKSDLRAEGVMPSSPASRTRKKAPNSPIKRRLRNRK